MLPVDQDFGVRQGKTLVEWLRAALSRDDFERGEAIQALSRLDASSTPALIEAMSEPDDEVLDVAVATLVKIGAAAIPRLTEALKHGDARVRLGATHALAQFGAEAESAIPSLADAVRDTEYVREGALSALFSIVPDFHELDEQAIRIVAQAALGPVSKCLLPVESPLRLDLGIPGTETMTIQEIASELTRGARFVAFRFCLSIVFFTVSQWSKPHFITCEQNAADVGWPYTLRSLLLGWWGLPFGPISTLLALYTNQSGEDVTPQTIADINERLVPYANANVLADGLEIARQHYWATVAPTRPDSSVPHY
jgi:hypothetical protein